MRAILFDFGGTLDFPRHWLDRFLAHYRAAGILISREELEPAFDAATKYAYSAGSTVREFGLTALIQYLLEHQFVNLRKRGLLPAPNSITANSGTTGSLELMTQIRDAFVAESSNGLAVSRPLLMSLAPRFRLGVVSNFYGNLTRILAEADLSHAVHAVADSGTIGFYKPDTRLFTAALTKLGMRPEETVMVGDSIAKDCVPAHAMGMRTVWLRHSENAGQVHSDAVDFTLNRLQGLTEYTWLKS
ncbi:MAG: HAD family hydrolase [Deltaproteobacteria bacterium]|nr:HAD family hydrolase [Deltaproteobacteria bacterium]